jgi:benzoylformate decarboxylase
MDKVFICPGSTQAAFLNIVSARGTVELLLAPHESISCAMADRYSRATGKPSVAFLHTNVGLNNGLSDLFAAKLARSPVVAAVALPGASGGV